MSPELRAFFAAPRRRIAGIEPSDLVQETLVRVYRHMESYRRDASLRTWVLRIAVNVWNNALRDSRAAKRLKETSLESLLPATEERGRGGLDPSDPGEDALDRLLGEERTQLLLEAIDALPKKMRRCALLCYRDQLTAREIATLLRVEPTTVKSHLQEARRRLEKLLRERFGVTGPLEPRGTPT